jgi:SNF2 family DNA or RNA helicase
LRGTHRFALTGTPMENSVRDLWSIMEFALPGYLGHREDFRQRYEIPIANGSKPEQARLRRRLAPFLLRRTKRAVAKDLPEKIEQTIYCELSAAQRDAYETFLRKGREQIQQLLDTQGFGKARMSILTTLLRLRQTCCHLRLIDKESDAASGKLEALKELVSEAIDGGHRVLIFSQFVNMLALIRESLAAENIAYAYLDGSTPAGQRAAQVKEFQSGDGPPLFLISLKAGGYGLTLTAADTVIHFDPWWNPAVENQATDRAHRIGQKRPVTAYKLITTGTIEERILALQKKKQSVIETALDDEAPMMSGLTEQDIREILS